MFGKTAKAVTLGCEAVDKITKFAGIVTARCEYVFGCAQWGITPPAKDSEVKNTQWFDEGRVERTGDGICPSELRVVENGAGDTPPSTNVRR